jgi:hypothetical protein
MQLDLRLLICPSELCYDELPRGRRTYITIVATQNEALKISKHMRSITMATISHSSARSVPFVSSFIFKKRKTLVTQSIKKIGENFQIIT